VSTSKGIRSICAIPLTAWLVKEPRSTPDRRAAVMANERTARTRISENEKKNKKRETEFSQNKNADLKIMVVWKLVKVYL
jgi:hypothetical protein